jgi:hypothetical protein
VSDPGRLMCCAAPRLACLRCCMRGMYLCLGTMKVQTCFVRLPPPSQTLAYQTHGCTRSMPSMQAAQFRCTNIQHSGSSCASSLQFVERHFEEAQPCETSKWWCMQVHDRWPRTATSTPRLVRATLRHHLCSAPAPWAKLGHCWGHPSRNRRRHHRRCSSPGCPTRPQ